MSKTTNYERETIISFNEAEGKASIYTYNKRWIAHLLKFAEPTQTDDGSYTFEIPKSWLRLPQTPRKPTQKQLQALEKARKIRNSMKG